MNHEDSQELLIFLITQMEEELGNKINYIIDFDKIDYNENVNNDLLKLIGLDYLKKNEMNNYSSIKNFFFGMSYCNINCSYCNANSPNFDSFITIPLDIPINKNKNEIFTLEQCLDNLTKNETLDVNNMINCNLCGVKNKSNKNFLFWKLPVILIFQIKRFIVNDYGIKLDKIMNSVIYPIENLDLSPYFHKDSQYIEFSNYDLIGINIHFSLGENKIDAGHYISIVKNINDNDWYLFNDSNEPQKLNKEQLQNSNTYLLFYYRKN
jgi:ubiquitin C-terminal hydrolase